MRDVWQKRFQLCRLSNQFHLMETVWRRFWGSGNNNNVVVSNDKTNSSEGSDEDEGELASKFPANVLQVNLYFQSCRKIPTKRLKPMLF